MVKCLNLEDWIENLEEKCLKFIYYGYYIKNKRIKNGGRISLISN